MKPISQDQQVLYVVPPKEEGGKTSVVKGVIIEVLSQATATSPGIARIDITERTTDGKKAANKDESLGHHTAIASYSEEKAENTFHFHEAKAPAAPAADPLDHDGDGRKGGSLKKPATA